MSISPHAGNDLLNVTLLFSLWYDQPHRPTRDVDLLGFGPDDIDTTVAAFREMCSMEVDDGIVFDVASIKGSVIRKDAGYGGVRIDLQAKLDGARIVFLKKNRLDALDLVEVVNLLRDEFQELQKQA